MSKSKAKGTAWETEVVKYLQQRGHKLAERRALSGKLDKGDIAGLRETVIECKAVQEFDLAGFQRELLAEMSNANAALGAVFLKRPRYPIQDGYAIMPIWLWLDLWEAWDECNC